MLVNNAATGGHEVPLSEATERQIQHAIRINLGGTLNMTQAVIPAMREGGGGSIVITGTLAMRRIQRGRGTYAASKSALMTAAQTLALELGQDNIRVNTVVPSYIMGEAAEVLVPPDGRGARRRLSNRPRRTGRRVRPQPHRHLSRDRGGRRLLRLGSIEGDHGAVAGRELRIVLCVNGPRG